ncbi:hypothetical protein HA46_12540 [Pantoea septica]|uniref:Uncharacterized protein n=1 Tax=Pantoea septica TaxID=472695 RepID=A0ABX3UQR5_9GAMM|nr:hypothetical protein HA46_12540 [Pantoea septica]
MMSSFYYLTQECDPSGCFVLHTKACTRLPDAALRVFIGTFYHPRDALLTAKNRKVNTKPCRECLKDICR